MDDEEPELDEGEDDVLDDEDVLDEEDDSFLAELPEPLELSELPEPEDPEEPFEDDAGVEELEADRLSVR